MGYRVQTDPAQIQHEKGTQAMVGPEGFEPSTIRL